MASSITHRIWSSADGAPAEIAPILSESHEGTVAPAWLQKKMGSKVLPTVAAIAETKDAMVGIVALGLNAYTMGGRSLRVGISYDTYVAPDWRGQGIFYALLGEAEKAARAHGAHLLLNFPNHNSRRGFEKAGWVPLAPVHPYVRPGLRPLSRLPHRLARLPKVRGHYMVPVRTRPLAPEEVSAFVRNSEASPVLQMHLDEAGIEARFSADRGAGYAMVTTARHAAVLRIGVRVDLREVHVMATAPRIPTAGGLRAICAAIERQYEPDVITLLSSASPRVDASIMAAGFFKLPSNTVPYVKPFASDLGIVQYVLSGTDIHTW